MKKCGKALNNNPSRPGRQAKVLVFCATENKLFDCHGVAIKTNKSIANPDADPKPTVCVCARAKGSSCHLAW